MTEQERRVTAGGIPDLARQRLTELMADGMTSSFFSAAQLAVGDQAGVTPVGQVVGASACRLAVGVIRRTRGPAGRLPVGTPVWRERDGPIRSWTEARQRALRRLSRQAEMLEADAVLGVGVRYGVREGEPPVVEVVFTGTAVRCSWRRRAKSRSPVLGLVSVQEFCLLRRAGVEVAGIAGFCSSVQVAVGLSDRRALGGRWMGVGNQELGDLTAGVYEARRLAVQRLRADAAKLKATGVVGVDLARSLTDHDDGHDATGVTVQLLGTAVRGVPARGIAPDLVLKL